MGSRPRLKPGYRPLRRGPGAVQLGSGAGGGIIVTGLAPGELALFDRLDGSLQEEDLYAAAAAAGVARERATQLLDLLRTHRVLLSESAPAGGWPLRGARRPARSECAEGAEPMAEPDHRARGDPTPRRRGRPAERPWMVVDGTGPLAASVATLLRADDLGRVDAGPWAADVADAELREVGHRVSAPGPAVVVLVGPAGLDPRAGEPWRRRGIPVLPVVADGGRVVVGPVVGTDPALPCLRCLRLHRVDHDAPWLDVLGQATTRDGGGPEERAGWSDPQQLRPDIASVAAGVAAMVARAVAGDDPVPSAVSVEVGGPWPRLDHRRWTRHPACHAHGPGSGPQGFEGPGREPGRLG